MTATNVNVKISDMAQQTHIILAATAAMIIFTSLFIKRIHRSMISEPVLVMLIGLALNMSGIKSFHITESHSLMNVLSRLTIIVALISTALRVKHQFVVKEKRNLSLLVPLAMLGMWLISSALFYLFIGGGILLSLLVGAIITPTDPVVASSMVTGELAKKLIPEKVRDILSFESGSNDGMAFPMVMLPFLLILYPAGHAMNEFFLKILLWENGIAIVLAGTTGFLLGKIYHYFHLKHEMDKQAIIGFSIAFTLFVYAVFEIIGTNSIASVFAAGVLFNAVISDKESISEESVQEVFERMLVVPVFFILGIVAPWKEWLEAGYPLLLFAIAILLFRRLPVFMLLKPILKGYEKKDILLMGWFGPIGVAALFYALHIGEKHHFGNLWAIVSFIVFASTVVHGFTRYYISRKYSESK